MFDEMAHSHGWIASGETVVKWSQSQSESAFGFWLFFVSGDISLILNINSRGNIVGNVQGFFSVHIQKFQATVIGTNYENGKKILIVPNNSLMFSLQNY